LISKPEFNLNRSIPSMQKPFSRCCKWKMKIYMGMCIHLWKKRRSPSLRRSSSR